jgi:hypothetical protein
MFADCRGLAALLVGRAAEEEIPSGIAVEAFKSSIPAYY